MWLPHNTLFVRPGTPQAVGESVRAEAPDKLDRRRRAYVPRNDPPVFAASRLLEAGLKEALAIEAPAQEGSYEFLCTRPGHWAIMQGRLIVTKDVDAYLKANPEVK